MTVHKMQDFRSHLMKDVNEYFYSLMRPKAIPKRRPCLRCRKPFLSNKVGAEAYRICPTCHKINAGYGQTTPYKLVSGDSTYVRSDDD